MKETRIQSAPLGDFHYQRFLRQAFVNRQAKGAYLANMARARTDDSNNQSVTDRGMAHCAKQYGLTVEELEELLMVADKNGVSILELHARLESGKRGEEAAKASKRRRGDFSPDDGNDETPVF